MSSCDGASPNCHFTCPRGGKWYVCPDEPYFVGCCTSVPCNNAISSTCPQPDIRPASFDEVTYNKIKPHNCINSHYDSWFTCNFTNPRFLGCCAINPCANGSCPLGDLIPAAWSANSPDQYDLFSDKEPTTNSTAHLSSGEIAGIAIGSVAVFVGIIVALFLLLRSRQWRKNLSLSPSQPSKAPRDWYGMYSLRPQGR
ncbi:uncharacterized protein BDW70DRAFT_167201 [Aspergillus foveolatus]|uniref:uncharacterized protein n=1 Tax=Aspergillus foveolatus TaxID=210207 RepID=UPI003CCDFA66